MKARQNAIGRALAAVQQQIQRLVRPSTGELRRRQSLREMMAGAFGLDELRALAFDLAIDYDNLPGESKEVKVISLLEAVERQDRLGIFIARLAALRPHLDWYDAHIRHVHGDPIIDSGK